jgi:putative protease
MEETRPGEYFPVEENERGTYIFNSKDLCMIEHIPDLLSSGIDSFKIEGRMKTALYVATVARTYRRAIDDCLRSEELYRSNLPWYQEQIAGCTYRSFTTGFFYGKPSADAQIYDSNTYIVGYVYLGIVESVSGPEKDVEPESLCICRIFQRNKFLVGDEIEIMKPDGRNVPARVLGIRDAEGTPMDSAPHPKQELYVSLSAAACPGDLLRIRNTEEERSD